MKRPAGTTMDASPEVRDQILNDEHLRLLAIGHYIVGGLHVAFASLFLFHFAFLAALAQQPDLLQLPDGGNPGLDQAALLTFFAWMLGFFILAGWIFGGLTIVSGRCIKARKYRTFTLVMAALNTLSIPLGTVLGVSTLVVLSREGVKRLYGLHP